MRARRIVVLKGPEEAARHTHPGYRDAALLLKRTDHRDQGAQERGLLGDGKLPDRFQQKVGPRGGSSRLAAASRGEHDDHTAAVARGRFLGDQALAVQGGDAV